VTHSYGSLPDGIFRTVSPDRILIFKSGLFGQTEAEMNRYGQEIFQKPGR
jgi:hypothetical protein